MLKKEGIMAEKDIIMMTREELKRLHVIKGVIGKKIKWKEAARIAGLSIRQIARLVVRVKAMGDTGIIHRLRGTVSNRGYDEVFKKKVIEIYRERYEDFGPTLAMEKFKEKEGIEISKETIRKWIIGEKEIECRWQRKGRKHCRWRERKKYRGEMVQMDGSKHDWFEGRGEESVMMGYIDDASNEVYSRFYEYEGTIPAMDSFLRYIRKYGIPNSLYADRHMTYHGKGKLTIEEELEGKTRKKTQFEQAVGELGVKMISAYSPQAKGRIERQFRTFQDRLIKEMRLRGIKNIEEANEFLKDYLPIYNKRFSVIAMEKINLHSPIPKGIKLGRVLCIKTQRTVRNDTTIAHETKLYQIMEKTKAKKVIVEEYINGTMRIYIKGGKSLRYKQITSLPKKREESKIKSNKKLPKLSRKKYIPPADHPWRKYTIRWQMKRAKSKGLIKTIGGIKLRI